MTPEEEQTLRIEARKFLEVSGAKLTLNEEVNKIVEELKDDVSPETPDAWWGVWQSTKVNMGKFQSEMVDTIIPIFTRAELADLNTFLSTPTGTKYRERNPIMLQNQSIQDTLWAREVKNELTRELRRQGYLN